MSNNSEEQGVALDTTGDGHRDCFTHRDERRTGEGVRDNEDTQQQNKTSLPYLNSSTSPSLSSSSLSPLVPSPTDIVTTPTPIVGVAPSHREQGVVRHSATFHKDIRPSLLTSSAEEQNFRGLFNLAALVLVVSHFRIVIENLSKYGILFQWATFRTYFSVDFFLIGSTELHFHVLVAFFLENWVAKRGQEAIDKGVVVATWINLMCTIALPSLFVYFGNPGFVTGSLLLLQTMIFWMKLVSYVLVNNDLRKQYLTGETNTQETISVALVDNEELVSYPNNLNLLNLYYFICAPTLIYQMNYPRTKKIRWYWLLGKSVQFIFFSVLMVIMVEQFIMPTIKNTISYHLDRGTDVPYLIARLLKLAIPSLLVWLIMFYTVFHLFMNILGELLRFGDRQFYHDWWNSTTLGEYWRRWNRPVHNWLVRHIYYPLLRNGYNKHVSALVIFFISAVFHELVASVPLSMIRMHFFMGMMLQLPLIIFTEKLMKGHQTGNIFFWLFFCVIGQPMIMLLYYHDYLASLHVD